MEVENAKAGVRFFIDNVFIENSQYFQGTTKVYGIGWTVEEALDEALESFSQRYFEEVKDWPEGRWEWLKNKLVKTLPEHLKNITVIESLGFKDKREDISDDIWWHVVLGVEWYEDKDNWVTK